MKDENWNNLFLFSNLRSYSPFGFIIGTNASSLRLHTSSFILEARPRSPLRLRASMHRRPKGCRSL